MLELEGDTVVLIDSLELCLKFPFLIGPLAKFFSETAALPLAWLENTSRELGAILVGLAATSVGLIFVTLAGRSADRQEVSTVEAFRRQRLRESSLAFRVFERGIIFLASFFAPPGKVEEPLDVNLAWKESEIWSAGVVLGSLLGVVAAALAMLRFGPVPGLMVFAVCLALVVLMFHTLATAALKSKEKSLLQRLPYVVDLMALVMEGGGSFLDALRTAGEENREHPLGQELIAVAGKIDQGRLPVEALGEFASRYPDENIRYLVSSINQGTELGVPLVQILRNQSDEMLRRRSQRIEKASAEAKVKISGPGFVIALACMLIMTAPFLLQVLFSFIQD